MEKYNATYYNPEDYYNYESRLKGADVNERS